MHTMFVIGYKYISPPFADLALTSPGEGAVVEKLGREEEQGGVGGLHLAHEVNQHLVRGTAPTQTVSSGGPLRGGEGDRTL